MHACMEENKLFPQRKKEIGKKSVQINIFFIVFLDNFDVLVSKQKNLKQRCFGIEVKTP